MSPDFAVGIAVGNGVGGVLFQYLKVIISEKKNENI
jgi:hypothetical protein